MKFKLTHIVFLPAVQLSLYFSPALPQEVIFKEIYRSEGKTFEHVTGMVQDRQGYMWFASKKGLYKYDGYHMTSFKNNPLNTNSIWLDPSTGKFTHYRHDLKSPASLSNDTVDSLLYDHQGTLWVRMHNDQIIPLETVHTDSSKLLLICFSFVKIHPRDVDIIGRMTMNSAY